MKLSEGLYKFEKNISEAYNVREYSDMLFDMIDEDVVDAKEIAKDLVYWCSEEDIKRFMELRNLITEDEDIDDYFEESYMNEDHIELSKKDGTAAKLLVDNKNKLDATTSKEQIIDFVTNLFKEAELDTPWTRKFLQNMNRKRDYFSALKYAYDAMLAADGLQVI